MDESERQAILRAIQAWQVASERLEADRSARLRAMTDEDVRSAAADLLCIPYPELPDRGSGLVEQQRLFHQAR